MVRQCLPGCAGLHNFAMFPDEPCRDDRGWRIDANSNQDENGGGAE